MLNDDYSCCDFIKFYYNVKVQYHPTDRSNKIPIIFFLTTIFTVFVVNAFLQFNQYYLYYIHGGSLLLMISLYISLLRSPTFEEK